VRGPADRADVHEPRSARVLPQPRAPADLLALEAVRSAQRPRASAPTGLRL
jgi:hypothetical protein